MHTGTADSAGIGTGGVWLPGGDLMYRAALKKDTLRPTLATDRGPAVAEALAKMAAAQRRSPESNEAASSGSRHHPTGWDHACSWLDSAPPASATRRDSPPLDDPILWRHPWPAEVAQQLVSTSNPDGSINNSELELAGTLAGNDVLAHEVDLTETTTATGTDNSAGLSWSTKGAVSTSTPAAYLLRLQSIHQRRYRYQQRNFFVPGDANRMADDASRLWNLSDDELLTHFNSTYPQSKPWRLCRLNPETASAIRSALLCERRSLPEAMSGQPSGPTRTTDSLPTPPPGTPTQPCGASKIPSHSCSRTRSSIERGSWHLKASPSVHAHRKRLFDLLGKRSRSWPSTTPGLTLTRARSTNACRTCGRSGRKKTRRQTGSSPSRWQCFTEPSTSRTSPAASLSGSRRA